MIKKLDLKTIEKIAAGEIIEAPVSIVKELVENSIDANAKNITVEIKSGGKEYIRVTDDGDGISREDLPLAFERHATSKINNFDDLYISYSLGFRGEALASILACCDVEIITKTESDSIGIKEVLTDSKVKSKEDIATNTGTTIIATNLFHKIPVRRKFLASDISESNKISKLMYIMAIGNPKISFKYIKDNREIFRTFKNFTIKDNISELLDDNLADNLIEIDSKNDKFKIKGYISTPNYYRGNRSLQYLYVNNRYVENEEIRNIIENKYKTLIPNLRFPAYQLFIDLDANAIDINIHPNKRKIKFIYESDLLDFLDQIIYEALNKSNKEKNISIEEKKDKELIFYDDYSSLLEKASPKVEDNYINDFYIEKKDESFNKSLDKDNYNDEVYNDNFLVKEEDSIYDLDRKKEDESIKESENKINIKDYNYKTSFFRRYSVFEASDKLLLLDHRLADQKIRFEEFKYNFSKKEPVSQILLSPIIIKLKNDEMEIFNDKKDIIRNIGFDVDLFDSTSIIIREVPQVFENPEDDKFFCQILDAVNSTDEYFYEKINSIIKSKSFRRGDTINEKEATHIIDKLNKFDNPFRTYDGKSCVVYLDIYEMEKYFER